MDPMDFFYVIMTNIHAKQIVLQLKIQQFQQCSSSQTL